MHDRLFPWANKCSITNNLANDMRKSKTGIQDPYMAGNSTDCAYYILIVKCTGGSYHFELLL